MSAQPPTSAAIANSRPLRGLVLACLGCGAWVALWWRLAAEGGQIPRPFAWWDIALASTICWTPLGLVIAEAVFRFSGRLAGVPAAGLLLMMGLFADSSSAIPPDFARLVWGGLVGISMAVLVQSFHRPSEQTPAGIWSLSSLLLLIPLAAVVTSAYTADRLRYQEKKIGEYLDQYRLMEARQLLARLQILDPQRTIRQEPLFMVANDLDRQLNSIREEAAALREGLAEGSAKSPAEEQQLRIRLAQNLAILGRMDEAAAELVGLTRDNPEAASAFILLATMREHQEDWAESLRYYEAARDALLQQPASPEQQGELVQAWKGIGYTQRKRGHYREAEAAYEEVLRIAPTAEHHFLMAQFYEDAQQGDKSQFHAYQAAELNPRAYRKPADELVTGMLGEQFGCWSIFRNRHR